MTEASEPTEDIKSKSNKTLFLISFVVALICAGGGFYASSAGIIAFGKPIESHDAGKYIDPDDVSFLGLDPITVTLSHGEKTHHLRFEAKLEVPSQFKKEVSKLLPRVTDVLNTYLRALEIDEIRAPAALTRLRAQMLRRAKIVVGEAQVNDLLVMQFVLN